MIITIPGEVPAKKNNRINTRSGRSFPSKKYQEWHDMASLYLKNKIQINNPVQITINFVHGTLRRRDSDNAVSSILDLLVDNRIIPDDNWLIVREINVFNEYQRNNAMCQIEIKEL